MNFHWLWLSEMLEARGRGRARAMGVHPWHPQATCTARLVAAQTQRAPSPSAQLPARPASTPSDPVSSDKTDGSGGDGAEGHPLTLHGGNIVGASTSKAIGGGNSWPSCQKEVKGDNVNPRKKMG